ncbi:UNVERIFIED_CONTAM: hypothetical protein GTU68_066070 [Idotea baltica]|nr:hypothetical protein [Idotea baltica]
MVAQNWLNFPLLLQTATRMRKAKRWRTHNGTISLHGAKRPTS